MAQGLNFSGIPEAGAKAKPQPSEVSLTLKGPPSEPEQTPQPFGQPSGAMPTAFDFSGIPNKPASLVSDSHWDQFWRSMYAAIPEVTGAIGGGLGATAAMPLMAVGGPLAPVAGGIVGASTGGIVGREIQGGIDYLMDRPEPLRNQRSVGEEANRQMLFEATGRVFSGLVNRFAGKYMPTSKEAMERLSTSQRHDLRLSPAEVLDRPWLQRTQYLAQRGVTGYQIQKSAQARSQRQAEKAILGILDTVSTPPVTATGIGSEVQAGITDATTRGQRRLEGAVGAVAPRTGMGATGAMVETGVQSSRTAFAKQQKAFSEMVASAPQVDMSRMHREAWRLFTDDILPKLEQNPTLGPNTKIWKDLARRYMRGSRNAPGEVFEIPAKARKMLESEALDKSTYAPLKIVRRILTTPRYMDFPAALELRQTLRQSGKGENLIAGDVAEGLATYLETGGRVSDFKGLRGLLAETHAPYEAAADAYRTNRNLFQSAFVEKAAESNPESVLATLATAEGRFNASRIRQMSQVLNDLPKTWGSPEEIAAGRKAWDTLRAEWFRREVMQDNVFGLSDRLKKVDADVLQAWFPEQSASRGRNALIARAEATGKAFESELLSKLAQADPSKVVDMIGATPAHVKEFERSINGLPGPIPKQQLIDRVRRAWVEERIVQGDLTKLADRIEKTDPELIKAWFTTPQSMQALTGLRRIGNALATRRPVTGMGAYESLAAVTIVGGLATGNVAGALKAAIGYEALPGFVSWAMYNPTVQKYLMEAASPTANVYSKTASMMRLMSLWQAAVQQGQQAYDADQASGAVQ